MTFWRSVIHFDPTKVVVWVGARSAAGIAIALAGGFLTGHAAGGAIAALGVLNVAFSDSALPYRQRGRNMLAASFLCGLAVFLGGLVGREDLGIIPLAAAAAFLTGMTVAIGQAATDWGNMALATLIVFAAQGVTAGEAAASGATAFAGGLLQIALSLALWPVHRFQPEQRALAALFDALARAARQEANSLESPPASAESTAAQQAIETLAGDHSIEAERYLGLASQAERIRLSLVALARIAARIQREDALQSPAVEQARRAAAETLAQIAAELEPGRSGDPDAAQLRALREAEEKLRAAPGGLAREAHWQVDALAGQLRGASQLAFHATAAGLKEFAASESALASRLRLDDVAAKLRANLSFRSVAFRHAVRLAACVGIGEAVALATGSRRGYWIPMTVGIVLRPEFSNTFSRGILRLGGTLAGLVLATGIVHFYRPAPGVQVGLIAAFEFAMRAFGPANYGIFVTALTALVVFLIASSGTDPGPVMAARGLNTLAGGAIALVAYAAWPTWERRVAPEMIADLFERYRDYFRAVRDAYLNPEHDFNAQLDKTRVEARIARSNVEALLARLPQEPGLVEARLTAMHKILADSHRFIHAVMALEAGLARSAPVPARDAMRTLSNEIDAMLYYLAAALKGSSVQAADLPDLRAAHSAMLHEGDPEMDRYALVNIETDRMVNSLNTLAEEVFSDAGALVRNN